MAEKTYVQCKYRVEYYATEEDAMNGCPTLEDRYIAGEYKHVEWDGAVLTVGKKKIYSEYAEEVYGYTGIDFLKIDGTVYVGEESGGGEQF
ncbi:MAG: hypothetical protein E7576_08010 [Ruminococcaceae bacterium]|nr:hypothetical protein [Oscillospiraceae bacterium]